MGLPFGSSWFSSFKIDSSESLILDVVVVSSHIVTYPSIIVELISLTILEIVKLKL